MLICAFVPVDRVVTCRAGRLPVIWARAGAVPKEWKVGIDESALAQIRQSLQAEDYQLDVRIDGDGAQVAIAAGPSACAECLVPKSLMRAMLAPALGVRPEMIELAYPKEH